ncbi:unnamed protein product [Ectocarpus sp. 6 AP-2014]
MDVVVGGVGRSTLLHTVGSCLSLVVDSAVWSCRALPFGLRAVRLCLTCTRRNCFLRRQRINRPHSWRSCSHGSIPTGGEKRPCMPDACLAQKNKVRGKHTTVRRRSQFFCSTFLTSKG